MLNGTNFEFGKGIELEMKKFGIGMGLMYGGGFGKCTKKVRNVVQIGFDERMEL